MDQVLLAGHDTNVHSLIHSVAARAKGEGVSFDGAVAVEYWWHLARIGVVAIPGESLGVTTVTIPRIVLTERGRQFLQAGELSPHNPSKYLAAVRRRIVTPDDVALSYLQEAVEAWRCGLNRSSAVMLGCACERLVLLLAEAIAGANYPPWSAKLTQKLQARVFISEVFDLVRKALLQLRDSRQLPAELSDAIDRKLSAVFDHARGLRNQSGHPTAATVAAEDAEAGLLLFPGFCELVAKLIMEVQKI